MIGLREIVYGVYGAYRLCRFDPQGLAYLNATHEGFWRSFFAAVLVAPFHFLVTLLAYDETLARAGLVRFLLIKALVYAIIVFAYPLAVFYLCRLVDRQSRFFAYVVGYNWATVVLTALLLPISLIDVGKLLPDTAAHLLELVANIAMCVMLWSIARLALQIPGITAALFVAIDLALTLVVLRIADARLAAA